MFQGAEKGNKNLKKKNNYEIDNKLKGGRNGVGDRLEIFCTGGEAHIQSLLGKK